METNKKLCRRCNMEKLFSEFPKDKSKKYGLASRCKACVSAEGRKYRSDPEIAKKNRERAAKWHKENREYAKQRAKDTAPEPLERALEKYGMSKYEYDMLLFIQDGKCAICETDKGSKDGGRLVIDHCHDTGQVRGLLCHSCNRGIGMLRDDARLLFKAFRYLGETQNVNVSMSSSSGNCS